MAWGRARRDAQNDMGNPSTACSHPAPWNSAGPLVDDNGRSYDHFWCNECGKTMRKNYRYD